MALFYIHLYETNSKVLNVLDFGGGLGTTHNQFLNSYPHKNLAINWIVVEQENFVSVGQTEFTSSQLRFAKDISSCSFDGKFVALALGVLQYLENPYKYLSEISKLAPAYLIIDATPFSSDSKESFSVQSVPASIYSASYVARVFNWDDLRERLEVLYELVAEWECKEQPDPRNCYKGAIFRFKE
jgi:putative methyltransferase (TIGR04325 family)